jgi:hypothetical protein
MQKNSEFHVFELQLRIKRLLQDRFFQFVQIIQLLPVDGFELFGFGGKRSALNGDFPVKASNAADGGLPRNPYGGIAGPLALGPLT